MILQINTRFRYPTGRRMQFRIWRFWSKNGSGNSVSPPFTDEDGHAFKVRVLKATSFKSRHLPTEGIRSSSVELGFGIQTGIFDRQPKSLFLLRPQSLSSLANSPQDRINYMLRRFFLQIGTGWLLRSSWFFNYKGNPKLHVANFLDRCHHPNWSSTGIGTTEHLLDRKEDTPRKSTEN